MAEILSVIENLTQSICVLERNFKKDGVDRKTSKYIKDRVDKLQKYYNEFKALEIGDNELINSAAQKLEKVYRRIYRELDNFLPLDSVKVSQKSRSSEQLDRLDVPLSLDAIKGIAFSAKRDLDVLNTNIFELKERLLQDLDISEDLLIGKSGIEALEHLIDENKRTKNNTNSKYEQEICNLNRNLTKKNGRLSELERLLELADEQDDRREDQIISISEREREESLRNGRLLKENTHLLEEIESLKVEISEKEELISKLSSNITCINKRRESIQHEYDDLAHQIQWSEEGGGKNNYILLIKELNRQKEELLKQNKELNKTLNKTRNRELEHLLDHHGRNKRGIVNGIGTLMKSISGVMDANDAERIDKKLANFEKTQKGLIEVQKDQLYAVSSFRKNINDNLEQLFKEQNVSRVHINEIVKQIKNHHWSDKTITMEMKLSEMITTINLEFLEVDRHQKETISILEALYNNRLHPAIVTKEALSGIYEKIFANIKMDGDDFVADKLEVSRCFTVTGKLLNDTLII